MSYHLHSLRKSIPSVICVYLVLLATALLGFGWTRDAMKIAALWLPNAILVVILLRVRGRITLFVAAGWLANVSAGLVVGSLLERIAGFATINTIEVLTVCWAMRRARIDDPNFGKVRDLTCFAAIAGLAVPAASGVLTVTLRFLQSGNFEPRAWFAWAFAHGLGMLVGVTLILNFLQGWRDRHLMTPAKLREGLIVLSIGTIITVAVFSESRFPLLFVVSPFVVVAAFRLGSIGTAISIALISVVAVTATSLGVGPISLGYGDFSAKILTLQAFLAINFSIGLPVAGMLRGLAQTQHDLHASRDFARSILDNMREVIFRTDQAGRWIFLNDAWEQMTGFRVNGSLGRPAMQLVHLDDRADAMALYMRLVAGDIDECQTEVRFCDADDHCCFVEVSCRALRDPDGGFAGTIGNIRDVTERRNAETALGESERRFQTLAALSPVGIVRTDALGYANYFNQAWADLTGLNNEEAARDGWLAGLSAEDRATVLTARVRMMSDREPYRHEFRYTRPDGTVVWTDTISTPEIDERDEIVGHIGIALDITDRRNAEELRVQNGALLEQLALNATDAIFRLDLDGVCLYASPSVRDLVGADPDTLVGHSVLDRFHPDDAEPTIEAFRRLARGEMDRVVFSYRAMPMDQPGCWHWHEAHCGLVRHAATGDPQEIIASIRDIRERKALEFELAAARDMAELTANAKATFLANMSHEIRTPMNAVIGFTELLLAGDLGDEQRRQARLIADSGWAMMRLLNDILDVSKIDAGQMQMIREPVNLHHTLFTCVKLMEPIAAAKGIILYSDIDDNVPKLIMGDGLRIRQIVLNLVVNALKFTENGTVTIFAGIVDGDHGRRLEIEVSDTGVGIAPDRQAAIFEQFVQSDATMAQHFGGTGLGLTISSQLAKLMSGDLTLDSTPGEGTSFFLRFPLEIVPALPSPVVAAPPKPVIEAGGIRVLVAEDNDVNMLLLSAMLERFECDVATVSDGEQAVITVLGAIRAGQPFDLILMDVQMPTLDGTEATRLIRAAGIGGDQLPIIALTANAFADSVRECLDAGMQAHYAKPLTLADLEEALARWAPVRSEARRRPAPRAGAQH